MNEKNLYHKALFSFFCFIIVVTKDILVADFHLLHERSPINGLINWLVILPLSIIGIILSLIVGRYYLRSWIAKGKIIVNIPLLLILPFFLYVSYYGLFIIIDICRFIYANLK